MGLVARLLKPAELAPYLSIVRSVALIGRRRLGLGTDRSCLVTCDLISNEGAVFALWGKPSIEDMDRVAEALRQAAAHAGRPVAYIARVPAAAPAPDPAVRRHLDTLMPEIVDQCSTYHVVLEGDGFMAAMKRAVLLGLFQIRWRRGVFFVHSTVSDVLRAVPQADHAAVTRVVELARSAGLLRAEFVRSQAPVASHSANSQLSPTRLPGDSPPSLTEKRKAPPQSRC